MIEELLKFVSLKSFKTQAKDIIEVAKYASEWEISKDKKSIRLKPTLAASAQKYSLFGFDIENGIRCFDKKTYDQFLEFKEYEENVILYST